jgi:hypothetical protein
MVIYEADLSDDIFQMKQKEEREIIIFSAKKHIHCF